MNLFPIIVIGVIIIALAVMATRRKRLKAQIKAFSEQIEKISYNSHPLEQVPTKSSTPFTDIPSDIFNNFAGKYISSVQEKALKDHYSRYFQKASDLVEKISFFELQPPAIITKFINDFRNLSPFIKQHNDEVIHHLLEIHKVFFNTCLTYPLDPQQRRSIVSLEENCLVVSSAGSGKTSSIVGKVKYLTEIQGIDPKRILLISYTNKAAAELTERMGTKGLNGYTFHKLALDIIGRTTGIKPSICDNTDTLFISIYHKLLNNPDFKKGVLRYFTEFQIEETDWERKKSERREQLSELKNIQLKAMFPDMDGNVIYVRSAQEQKICFILSSLGIKFRYEEEYEHPVADAMYSQYRPDFSIYFKQDGKTRRIYLEHFGVDEHSLVPEWFAKDKNMSYEEANKKYNDGITWKRTAHNKFGTKLLTTSSADFYHTDIKEKLKLLLTDAGVPICQKSEEELYDLILPKNSKQEKSFIRLVATFITLAKSSCEPIQEIIRQVEIANDDRSEFIIKHIFLPVYKHYIQALQDRNQIDFTDAILQATEICRSSHPVEFDYIIVDEFQDISIDRYNFLKVLREGNPPAKLYCVGDDWQSIYRFSGSDMALFNQFPIYFGATEVNRIETTYRFGEPLISMSSAFIQRNSTQLKKNIHPFNRNTKTELEFCAYDRNEYCNEIEKLIASIPANKSIFLLGRYSFDDYYLSFTYRSTNDGNRFYYIINGRKIEFLTVHKPKGLEADYVILLQCNKDTYGFPSMINDDPVLNYVLTKSDQYPFGEERRLFYVAITRAKVKTIVLYDKRFPSIFVSEFLHPEKITEDSYAKHPNANKRWTQAADQFLLSLHNEGKSIKYISSKMGRSQTSIVMRLNKLKESQ